MSDASASWPCLRAHAEGVVLALKVSPNARKTNASGLWRKSLRLRVQAPPVEGKANRAIFSWAARTFNIKAARVELLRGEKASAKSLLLRGLSLLEAEAALEELGIDRT